MAVQLSPNGKWLYGDTPQAGAIGAVLASTVVSVREELVGVTAPIGTHVTTSQGVSALFGGQQAMAIYNLIKDITIIVV